MMRPTTRTVCLLVALAAMHLLCSCGNKDFAATASRGDLAASAEALAADPSLANKSDATGSPPLITAAGNGREDVVVLLLKNGANVNVREPRLQTTALHWASFKGHLNVVELLLRAGADVNARNAIGQSPFDMAASSGETAVMQYLSQHGGRSTDATVR